MEGGIASRVGTRAEDRYGLVIVLVILSYWIAAAYGGSDIGRMVMILVQLVTVWLVFTVSEARRAQRLAAGMVLVVLGLLAVAVLGSLSVQEARWATDLAEGPLLLILVALYALTPVVIVAHVIRRPGVDREAFFGGVAAYLLIGMTYAFAYVALGEFRRLAALLRSRRRRNHGPVPVLQLHDPDDHRVRRPCPGRQPRPVAGDLRSRARTAVPGDGAGQDRLEPPRASPRGGGSGRCGVMLLARGLPPRRGGPCQPRSTPQSRITLPELPLAVTANASAKSSIPKRWVITGERSIPACSREAILYQVSNISRP